MKIYSLDDVKQGSLAWKMLRLGKITSSNVYCLMSNTRNNELFTETAKSYLYGVASELMLNKKYSSESFMEEYFERVDATTKQMRYGTGLELKHVFKKFPNLHVVGVDYTQAMLDKLQENYPQKNLELIRGDYFKVDFGKEHSSIKFTK